MVGGLVQDIQWNATDHRVAISFRDTSYICLLCSRPGPVLGRLSKVW